MGAGSQASDQSVSLEWLCTTQLANQHCQSTLYLVNQLRAIQWVHTITTPVNACGAPWQRRQSASESRKSHSSFRYRDKKQEETIPETRSCHKCDPLCFINTGVFSVWTPANPNLFLLIIQLVFQCLLFFLFHLSFFIWRLYCALLESHRVVKWEKCFSPFSSVLLNIETQDSPGKSNIPVSLSYGHQFNYFNFFVRNHVFCQQCNLSLRLDF